MARNFVSSSSQALTTASSPASGSPMTIAGWAKVTNNANSKVIASVCVNGGTNRNQVQTANGSNCVIFAVGASETTASRDTGGTVDAWNHYAGVFASQTSRTAFVNGISGAANTANCGSQAAADSVVIGARINTTLGNYMLGDIAEVGVWNVALTAEEIASLAGGMTCDKVRPQSLVFYAPLVRNLQDVKGGLTITNNNTATVTTHPRVYA